MNILPIALFDYKEPWINKDIYVRLNELNSSSKKIAYYSSKPNCSSFRYRVYNMVEAINYDEESSYSASFFFESDYSYFEKIIACADLLIIHRSMKNFYTDEIYTIARSKNIPVLFDCDDLVIDSSFCPMIMKTIMASDKFEDNLNYWYSYTSRMNATLMKCDGFISSNSNLSKYVNDRFNIRSCVIDNFLNKQQEDFSKKIALTKKNSNIDSKFKFLGIFSGSPSHSKDFELIVPHLIEILMKHKHIKIVIAGYLPIPTPLLEFSSQIERLNFTDYINLQINLASVDVHLVPLQSNFFTSCKSPLKFFESAIVDTLVIASNTEPYSALIKSEKNGILSEDYNWFDKIETSINLSSKEKEKIFFNAQKSIKKYSFYRQNKSIIKELNYYLT